MFRNFEHKCIDEKEKIFIYKENDKYYLATVSPISFMDIALAFSAPTLEKAKAFLKETDCLGLYKILQNLKFLRTEKYKDFNPDLKDAFFDCAIECFAADSDKSGNLKSKIDIEKFASLKEKIISLNEEDKKVLFSIVNDINLIFNKICGE
jgi:hypothetical protein